jgi:V/A-type H+-transporting ATPase subunit I
MAVSRMKKIQLLVHMSTGADVVAALREEGVLHVTEPAQELDLARRHDGLKDRERELAGRITKLEYIRNLLRPYHTPSKKGLDRMFNPHIEVTPDDLGRAVADLDVDTWYRTCVDLEGRMRSAEAEIARKEALAATLSHWEGLSGPVESVGDTRTVRGMLATIDAGEYAELVAELATAAPESEVREISRAGSTVYITLLYMREHETDVAPILKRHNVRAADLSGAAGRPGEAAQRLREEAAAGAASIEEMKKEAEVLAGSYEQVLVVLDEASESLARESVRENFGATESTYLIEGWMRTRDQERVEKRLAAISPDLDLIARDPEPGESVPIDLRNRTLVSPFEFVTTLYGRPVYSEFDPTPLLAPFFIVFFGLCVSDAGYGLTLAALSFFLMTKMQPGGGKQLMKLLFMGGISTAVVGAIMGSWFGIDPSILPTFIRNAVVLDPLHEPMKMLNVVFILGIVQIFTGLSIKMVADFRDGNWADGILDQFIWIVFLTLLVPLGYGFILGGDVPPAVNAFATKGAMIVGAIVVLTGARKTKNPIMKLLGGVLKLYDIVGYFGDVLSYARLLALGLATGAIAMAINGVAKMALGIPIAGPVMFVFILIGGHLFNIAVNCLGGFVHSARLQYLEYFAKFFTGGGRPFEPFRTAKKYSIVKR